MATTLDNSEEHRISTAKMFIDLVYGEATTDNAFLPIWNSNTDYNNQHPNSEKIKRNVIHSKLCAVQLGNNQDLAEAAVRNSSMLHSYMRFNAVNEDIAMHHCALGSKNHITYSPGFLLDIDFGDHGTQVIYPPTIEDALVIANSLELKPSIVLNSGRGLYAIWLFHDLLKINPANFHPYEETVSNLHANIRRQANDRGWTVDATDITKGFRLPGTFNWKYHPKHEVTVVQEFNGTRYALEDFETLPQIKIPSDDRVIHLGIEDYIRPAPADIKKITDKCPAMAYCWDNRSSLDYYSWLAMLSITARCDDDGKASDLFSKDHPSYNSAEVKAKIEEVKKVGPWRCQTIHEKTDAGIACNDCKYYQEFDDLFNGKQKVFMLSTPLQIGDSSNKGIEADVVSELNQHYAALTFEGKFLVLNERDKIVLLDDEVRTTPSFTLMDTQSFYNELKPYTSLVWTKKGNEDIKVQKEKSKIWFESERRRAYNGMQILRDIDAPGVYNLWRGFQYEPKPGDWSLFRNHILEILADGDVASYEYLLKWMAFIVQKGGRKKSEVALVFRGKERTGKGTFFRHLSNLFHNSHSYATQEKEQIVGKFNGHLLPVILLMADEAHWAGDHVTKNKLKGLITEAKLGFEYKFRTPTQENNYINLVISTNESWSVNVSEDGKRFFVLDINNSMAKNRPYFKAIQNQMVNGGYEAMLFDLLKMDIEDFDPTDFPKTTALFEQKLLSDPLTEFAYNYLEENRYSWQTRVSKRKFFEDFLEDYEKNKQAGSLLSSSAFFRKGNIQRLFPSETNWNGREGAYGEMQVVFPSWEVCARHFEKVLETPTSPFSERSTPVAPTASPSPVPVGEYDLLGFPIEAEVPRQ